LRDAVCRRLQCSTDRQDQTAKPDTILAPKSFTGEQAEYGSSEAPDLVDCYYKSLEGVTTIAGRGVDLRELVRESRSGQEAAHDTLVWLILSAGNLSGYASQHTVSHQQETSASSGCDGPIELAACEKLRHAGGYFSSLCLTDLDRLERVKKNGY
jgi:hypothetical protein